MHQLSKHLYEFGPFQLDVSERMLLREGQYVPLTPKAMDTLVVLVEYGGRIVEKEELLKRVWPDTFVEETCLTKNVSTLRKALGETEGRRFIETVPKRGYRFVAEVRLRDEENAAPGAPSISPSDPLPPPPAANQNGTSVVSAPTPEPARPPEPSPVARRPLTLWILAGAVLAVAAGLALWVISARQNDNPRSTAALKTTPLTSFPGHQNQAGFSPDGQQIAFVWDGPQSDGPHIYVKSIGSENVQQLTHGAGTDSKPAWAPDGRSISFLRSSGDRRAWYLVSTVDGAERKLVDVFPYFDLGTANSSYYSPDGEHMAIVDKTLTADPAAIYLLSVNNPARRQLTWPPAGTTGDYYPAFSPDGKLLAFARAMSFSATDLYVLPLAGGNARRLTFDGLTIDGLTWTTDSREIIFSSRRGGSTNSLWRIPSTGGKPERVSTVGEDVISPALSRDNRLAYTRALDDMNIWAIDLDDAGHVAAKAPLIVSTFRDSDPDYSPDGHRIAFTSGRLGGFGIWVSNSDGANPRLIFDGGPYVTGSPRWSPDGRWIVFDSRANDPGKAGNPNVWIANAEGGQVRPLTKDPSGAVAPSWSHDGQWIYFASPRSGNLEVWKMPAAGGNATQVTRTGGFEAFESADGRFVYYLKGRAIPGIWRVPVGGGEEVRILDREQAGFWRCWRLSAGGIYFVTAMAPAGPRLSFFDLATGRVREVAKLPKSPDITIPSLAVSPDGRHLLYAQYDQSGSNIMMSEGLR